MTGRRVVVSGRGVVSPLGVGAEQQWESLAAERSAVAPLARLEALGLAGRRGAMVGADLLQPYVGRLPRKQQKLYGRATLLGMLAASLAMEDAGLAHGVPDPERFAVVLGVNVLAWDLGAMTQYLGAAESSERRGVLDMVRANQYCMRHINPLDFSLKTLPNLSAGHIAIAHNAQGICRALTEGPVGGAHAIIQACGLIADGGIDVALAGGADCQLEELLFATYCGAGLLAADSEGSEGQIAGEGAALVVLEEAERARERGARIHGVVLGMAVLAGDGVIASEDEPGRLGRRVARAIRATVEQAGGGPDVVVVHGDGAAAHDAAELIALESVLGSTARETPPLFRLKRQHGDLGAASAAVEIVACFTLLERAMIPSTALPGAEPPRRALLVSLGYFGECVALMLGKADVE